MLKTKMCVAIIGLAFATIANAVPSLVTSRLNLNGNDYYDWRDLGAAYTVVSDPFAILSDNGLQATVDNPTGQFERRDQNNGWAGNFANGDNLLWTRSTIGPMLITFATPVYGVGAQIQANFYGEFTATMKLYDSLNNLLSSFNLVGQSNANSDNSAIFLGSLDTTPQIKRIEYSVVDNATRDFAINQLDIVTGPAPIPEPASLVLLGIGLAGLGFTRRRRRA